MKTGAIMGLCAASLALAACNQASGSAEADPAVQAMMDRIAIEDMVVHYYAHLGGGDAGAFHAYFTEDAIFDVNGIVANGREEIAAIYAGMQEEGSDNSTASEEGPFRMILSNPVIEVDGETATASFIWTGITNTSIDAPPVFTEQGREYDKLVKVDGVWKFQHRVVVADSGLPADQYEGWTRRADFRFDTEQAEH